MKNLYNNADVKEIEQRIDKLTSNSQRQWGKMNVAQMLAHCNEALKTATDETRPPRVFIGRIFGPLVKKSFLSEKPFPKNGPTAPSFVIKGERDFEKEKQNLKRLVEKFAEGKESGCTQHPHSFFGKLKPGEWSVVMYKHLNHHLTQFGV